MTDAVIAAGFEAIKWDEDWWNNDRDMSSSLSSSEKLLLATLYSNHAAAFLKLLGVWTIASGFFTDS